MISDQWSVVSGRGGNQVGGRCTGPRSACVGCTALLPVQGNTALSTRNQRHCRFSPPSVSLFISSPDPVPLPTPAPAPLSPQQLEPEIKRMSLVQKRAFLAEFSDHPALVSVNAAGADPFQRMEKLMALPDADLRAVLKMQAVVVQTMQEGGSLESILPPPPAPASSATASAGQSSSSSGSGSGSGSDPAALHRFLSGGMMAMGPMSGVSISPLTEADAAAAQQQAASSPPLGHTHDGHDHGHDHAHTGSCDHSDRSASKTPDVDFGKSTNMDR